MRLPRRDAVIIGRDLVGQLVATLVGRRKKAGLTQRCLADRIYTVQSYVSSLEKGEVGVSVGMLQDWCRQLGIRPTVTVTITLEGLDDDQHYGTFAQSWPSAAAATVDAQPGVDSGQPEQP